MINVAIFNLRDLLRNLIKFFIIVTIIVLLINIYKFIKKIPFDRIINNTIPAIYYLNNSEKSQKEILKENIEQKSWIKTVLSSQLEIKNNIMPKEISKEIENTQEISEDAQNEVIIENEEVNTNVDTQIMQDNNIVATYTNTYNTVQIKNSSKYELTEEILNPNDIAINKKDILIFHTHTCESYTPSEKYNYTMTGTYRTTDLNYSVSRVGDELQQHLTKYGYNVYHDKTINDYPAYTGSYNRSLEAVKKDLNNLKDTQIIFDLHRDAVGSKENYAPKVKIGDEYAAQIMFVIGTDGGGLVHPNWRQNLKFAVKVQEKANELYPGLFRPIILRNSRYNQHLSSAATIIEVGATGNTLDECLTSMKYFSYILNEALN